MIVYGNTISPFVRKVVAFGSEKGLTLEVKNAGMGRGGPEFEEASPFKKMPGFRDGDFCISDSSAIVTYLEAAYPDPNLIPLDPKARARTIWYDEFADTIFGAAGTKLFFNRFVAPKVLKRAGDMAVADAAEREELPPLLAYLERVIPDSGFLVEDRITLADIAVASPFVNMGHIECVVDPELYPRTAAYIEAILARPSFAPVIEAERRMVAAM